MSAENIICRIMDKNRLMFKAASAKNPAPLHSIFSKLKFFLICFAFIHGIIRGGIYNDRWLYVFDFFKIKALSVISISPLSQAITPFPSEKTFTNCCPKFPFDPKIKIFIFLFFPPTLIILIPFHSFCQAFLEINFRLPPQFFLRF